MLLFATFMFLSGVLRGLHDSPTGGGGHMGESSDSIGLGKEEMRKVGAEIVVKKVLCSIGLG